MPGLSTPRDLAKVRRQRPDVRVVVLNGSDNRDDILAALEAGVHGYIGKSIRAGTMIERIKYVLSGEIYVPPVLAELPSEVAAPDRDKPARASPLTQRQNDVLRLMVDGKCVDDPPQKTCGTTGIYGSRAGRSEPLVDGTLCGLAIFKAHARC